MIQLASWNVNGIRACHKNGFSSWLEGHSFDVIGLQEVRADETQIPESIMKHETYKSCWFGAQKKGYSGTGILSRTAPLKIWRGMDAPEFDAEGRVLTAEFKNFHFVSAYFPNSQEKGARIDYKLRFCKRMHEWLDELRSGSKPVVLCGDYNIAHERMDLARPDDNEENPGFLPQEREWMTTFVKAGWLDTFRTVYPEQIAYSWWSARMRARERNVGWRIDYHSVHSKDKALIANAGIQTEVLGSDHCPVTLELKLDL